MNTQAATIETPVLGHNRLAAIYSPFREALAELRSSDVTFDYEDKQGNKDARSHVAKLRKAKADVDRARKDEKAESLAYGRLVDSEAKEIVEGYEALIAVHLAPLKEIEELEAARVEHHTQNMLEIQKAGEDALERWTERSAEAMQDRLSEIEAEPTGADHWEEFAEQAAYIIKQAKERLVEAIEKRKKHDVEQAELARHRKEEEERNAEQREREQKERDEKIAREAAERAERETTERLEREAKEKAEREAEVQAARERDRKHKSEINKGAVLALVKHAEIDEDAAKRVIRAIANQSIPALRILY